MSVITCRCGESVEVGPVVASRQLRCPKCGESLRIPDSSSTDSTEGLPDSPPQADRRLPEQGIEPKATTGRPSGPTASAGEAGKHSHGVYRILRSHAKGGMGRVSVARDEPLKREVALKELLESAASDPDCRYRFVEEAEITGQLEHPGIVPVYALGMDRDGRPYYAMRFVRGKTLKQAIDDYHRERTPARLRELLRRFVMVCQTMAYAHARGIIHRDLKPPNIMLGDFGETLVLDWGLARPAAEGMSPDSTRGDLAEQHMVGRPEVTEPGRVMGTPAYMSPEQATGQTAELTKATDIYSLGAVLYQLLTGRPAYSGSSSAEVIEKVRTTPPEKPSMVLPGVPRPLEAVCLKAMARRPEDRYSKAISLAEEVKNWLDDEPVAAYRESVLERAVRWSRRHKSWVAASALTLLVVLVTASVGAVMVARERAKTTAAEELVEYYEQVATEALEQAALKEDEADRKAHEAVAAHRKAEEAKQRAADASKSVQQAAAKIVQLEIELKAKTDQAQQLRGRLDQTRADLTAAEALAATEAKRAAEAARLAESLEQEALALRREAEELRRIAAQAQQIALLASGRETPISAGAPTSDRRTDMPPGLAATEIPPDPNAPPRAKAPFDAAEALKHQQTWAAYLKASKDHTNSIGMKMVLIPPGEFDMGLSQEEIDRAVKVETESFARDVIETAHPKHRVTLTRPLYVGIHEVTVGQFARFINATGFWTGCQRDWIGGGGGPKPFNRDFSWRNHGEPIRDDQPVANITWNDATEFCRWLSHQEGRTYRLPTEAEWEYSCRGGTTTQFFSGDTSASLQGYANIADSSHPKTQWNEPWDDGYPGVAPVGSFKPNPFGLHDMLGNVEEWCADALAAYSPWPVYDPSSPPEKVNKPWHRGQRVVRGGTWYSEPRRRNTAYRHAPSEHYRQITLGFRIVAELTRELKQAAAPPDPSAPPIALAPFDAVQARRHQETWAKHLGLPREWTNPLGMTFVLVPSGKFEMGSDEAEVAQLAVEATRNLALPWYPVLLASEQPKRRVTISEPFYLSKYETTVSQFRRFSEQTGYKPDRLKESGRWEWFAAGVDPVGTQPVVWVSDRDAVAFCRWLSDRDDASYELPTEAEWEYACRAGTTTRYSTGNDPATLQRFANVADAAAGENHAALQPFADLDAASKRDGQWRWSWASWNDGFPATAPVGRFKPNPFGLHDMHGNVGEICADRHDKDFYTHAPVEDPRNDYGDFAVVRGCGCIVGFPDALRSSYRHVLVFGGPGYHGYYPDTGFRVVLRIRARSNTAKPTSQ